MLLPLDFRRNTPRTARHTRATTATAALLISASLLVVGGCGGGGTGHSTPSPSFAPTTTRNASLTLALTWPATPTASASGRAFPVAANSLTIIVTDSTGYSDTQTLVRPPAGSANTTTTANFFALSAGQATVTASAFTSSDGSGPAVSQATTPVVLQTGQQTVVTLDFPSPLVSITLTPITQAVLIGSSAQITATATDDRNNTITPIGTWASSNPNAATVDANGKVFGVGSGTAVITFTDSVFGKTGQAAVAVRGVTQIAITPVNPKIAPGTSVVLSATELDANDLVVQNNPPGTWTTSDATVAPVDASGKVTGLRIGTATISFKDSVYGVTGTTTVTVRGGDAQVIVQ